MVERMCKKIIALVLLSFPLCLLAESLREKYESQLTPPRIYNCYQAKGNIKVDGKLNDKAWQEAEWSEPFVDISGYDFPIPTQATRVKMLYDEKNLYVGARLEEKNIVAKLTQRDTIIYHDNDFEVFIDPDGDGLHYFEIENNARGVIFDLMLDKPYRSGGSFFIPWDCPGLQLKVAYEGTLNKTNDVDKAWTVEMAIPIDALSRDFRNPRDFKVWRINFSRVQWPTPGAREENWVWSPTGRIDMHMPERWGFLNFVDGDGVVPHSEIDMQAYNWLWSIFYAEQDRFSTAGRYYHRLQDFNISDEIPYPVKIEATSAAFEIKMTVGAKIYSVNQDGRFRVDSVKPVKVKNWAWIRLKDGWTDEQYRNWFKSMHDAGISALLFEGYDENAFRVCKEVGMEAHYWKWTLNRREVLELHPEWFAVSRDGKSCYDNPAYVEYYRFLCPSRSEVVQYLAEDYLRCARLPYVDGMHLDYVRYPDVILPVSLWKNYRIEQTKELAEYDFCYCDVCREKFKVLTGRDPLDVEFPQEDQSWINFRLDAITRVVKAIADEVRGNGYYLSGAVFPGPTMAKRMVRQDWGNWCLDAYFPMIYNGFYYEGPSWVGRSVQEGVTAIDGRADLYAGLMCTDLLYGDDFEKALDEAFSNGAAGVSFFDGPQPEQLKTLRHYLDSHNLIPVK